MHPTKALDLDAKSFPEGPLYILDASAVIRDPSVDEYSDKYELASPATFIITTPLLAELDRPWLKKAYEGHHYRFMELLRTWSGEHKLSSSPVINTRSDRVHFLRFGIHKLLNEDFDWLDDHYTDRQLLCLAAELQRQDRGRQISMISGDALLNVLCKEHNFGYVFIPEPPPKVAKSDNQPRTSTAAEEFKYERGVKDVQNDQSDKPPGTS